MKVKWFKLIRRMLQSRREVRRLRAAIADKAKDEISIRKLQLGGVAPWKIEFTGGPIKYLAFAMLEFFRLSHPEGLNGNYIMGEMVSSELGDLILTIQRKGGKTPHELRMEAESKCVSLNHEIDILMRKIKSLEEDDES
jgi:hypothetical protein